MRWKCWNPLRTSYPPPEQVLYGDLNIRSYTCLSGTTSDYSIGQRLVARVEAPATLSSKDSAALLMPKEQVL